MPNTAALSTEDIDFLLYQQACAELDKPMSKEAFENEYTKGNFNFHDDSTFILDLIHQHQITVTPIQSEWLACHGTTSSWSQNLHTAVCLTYLKIHAMTV